MKYDLDLEVPAPGTSHAVVLDLVGTGKRVIDVGCSTGYLARLISARGNTVSGVELDPEAAAAAAAHLAQIVVGDLSVLDLTEHFPPASYDVLVFADVLEHLVDPSDVLRRSLPLLAPGGSVVVSIPNVAHGAVRLHLLEGNFEYRPLGLLDDTHLRFFTRSSLEAMLRSGGVLPVDVRRTTADVLATEIPVVTDHFPASIVDEVRRLPEADTYQFVLRAIPRSGGASAPDGLLDAFVELSGEVTQLRRCVDELARASEGISPPSAVAIVADPDPPAFAGMRAAVVASELQARMPRSLVQLHHGGDGPETSWSGAAMSPLPGDPAELGDLATALGAVVVVGPRPPQIAALADLGVPVRVAGAPVEPGLVGPGVVRGAPGDGALLAPAAPDPLVLVDRLFSGQDLSLHLDLLAALGRLPPLDDAPVVVVVDGSDVPPDALGLAVAELSVELDARIVVTSDATVDPGHRSAHAVAARVPGSHVLESPSELDLAALLATARHVLTTTAEAAAVALAFGRPVNAVGEGGPLAVLAAWAEDPELVVATPGEVLRRSALAVRRAAAPGLLDRLQQPLDLALDDLAATLRADAAARVGPSSTQLLRTLARRAALLEDSNDLLRRRLASERAVFGQRLRSQVAPAQDAGRGRIELAEQRAAAAEADADAARAELRAHNATLAMRALAPSRRLYGRIRRLP